MAIRRIGKSRMTHGGKGKYRNVFALDSEADIGGLPTGREAKSGFMPVAADSMAIVIGDGGGSKIFMLNGEDQWLEV